MTVGAGVRRREGVDKVTGRAAYVDDLVVPGMLHARTVRTAVPRGRLERIDVEPDLPWDDIVVVTARDVPGRNVVALLADDQPCLVEREIRHAQEPVVLLAHADRALLERAARAVTLVVTAEPPVLDLDAALAGTGPGGTFADYTLARGDVERALAAADLVVEGVYETGAQEHVYIEPQGRTAQRSGELITRIALPRPAPGAQSFYRKVGTRRAQTISKVCLAGLARWRDGVLEDARLALGSVAATVVEARGAAALLVGRRREDIDLAAARAALDADIAPIDDVRSTAAYRRRVAGNLLEQFVEETAPR